MKVFIQFTKPITSGLLAIGLFLLSSCQWEQTSQTSIRVIAGGQVDTSQFSTRVSVVEKFPSLGKVWLEIETSTLATEDINDQYNNGALTLNEDKSAIIISDTDVALNVPTDEEILLTITAYNKDDYKVFSGSKTISVGALKQSVVDVVVPIKVDIDEKIQVVYDSNAGPDACTPSIDGFYCLNYKKMLLEVAGFSTDDGIDSDGDLVPDLIDNYSGSVDYNSATKITVSNNGYPMFMVANRRPVIPDVSATVEENQTVTVSMPSLGQLDEDVNDYIYYTISEGSYTAGYPSVNGETNEIEFDASNMNLETESLDVTFSVEARDLATQYISDKELDQSLALPVIFNVTVTITASLQQN